MEKDANEVLSGLGISFVFLLVAIVATLVSVFQLPVDWVRKEQASSSLNMLFAIVATAAIGVGISFNAALRLNRDIRDMVERRESRSRDRSKIRLEFEDEIAVYRNNQRLLAIRFDEGEMSANEFHEGYANQERIIGVVHEQHFSRMAGI